VLVADIDPDRQALDANRRRPVELEVPSFSSMDVAIGAVEIIAPIGANPPLIAFATHSMFRPTSIVRYQHAKVDADRLSGHERSFPAQP
jgi:hypothetical protein